MASRIKRPSRPRYTFVDVVEVYLWGELMGAVALDPRYGFYAL